jgi:hypothetical protein
MATLTKCDRCGDTEASKYARVKIPARYLDDEFCIPLTRFGCCVGWELPTKDVDLCSNCTLALVLDMKSFMEGKS